MHHRRLMLALLSMTVLLPACHHHPVPPGATPPLVVDARPGDGWEAGSHHVIDSVAARMAELELQRLALRAAVTDGSIEAQRVVAEITSLERLLAEEQPSAAASRMVADRVLDALDARHAGLLVERTRLLVLFTPGSAPMQQLEREMQALAERRSEVQAHSLRRPASR